MRNDQFFTILAVLLFGFGCMAVYIHFVTRTLAVNSDQYEHVGMMQYPDGNEYVYTPVYKRIVK